MEPIMELSDLQAPREAGVFVVAPALSWRLRDVPLSETAPVEASEPEPRTPAGSSAGG